MASWVSEMDSEEKIWDRWEEVVVSNDRGRREVHYYLRDCGGGRDLAVVGREKSARHMSYVVPSKFMQSLARISAPAFPSAAAAAAGTVPWDLKWRSRREVVDWLSSLVSEHGVSAFNGYSDDDAGPTTIPISKSLSIGKMGVNEKFSWLGSAWECRKRLRHYRSFCRNGVTISVHDFVYVMAEDYKRLVAYVEDLYEDSKANYMVVVRWLHKVDEVGIVLPPDTNDREIFFSLCLQHFSVECIDGVAAVLGLQDFEKFQKEARQMCSSWEPYLCRSQMDIDDIKPFDVTQVQGYWSQDVLRSLYSFSLKLRLKIKCHGSTLDTNKNTSDPQRSSKKAHLGHEERGLESSKSKSSSIRIRSTSGTAALTVARKQLATQTLIGQQHLIVPGLEIELLSQDSGIRGCWFRAVVLKRHRDMIKVQYHDVEDADGSGNLEEWVSVSRVAATDKLGIRINGRPMVRPCPTHLSKGLCSYGVGKVVDAWWHDGWWEGVVINDQSEGKIHVYFPGEKQVSIFTSSDLRPSQDWVDNKWNDMKDKPNIASLASTDVEREKLSECITFQALASDCPDDAEPSEERGDCFPPLSGAQLAAACSQEKKENSIPDLIDFHHDSLKWNPTRKRSRSRKLFATELWGCKRQRIDMSCRDSRNVESKESKKCGAFVIPKSLKAVDRDHCKMVILCLVHQ
ncbi:hypothetical protein HPP92_023159 [Vanilla planifolia]|uniref:BAH domain-containing protein n=1 Tax=Vanilla planifolia TaxID=51239 RepID=A0A835UHX6_VANPL|nr:hypothetical protein HPP92_023159 [Vanilla planifolia]